MLRNIERNPDQVITNDNTTFSECYLTIAQNDPPFDKEFTMKYYDQTSGILVDKSVTNKILWINAASGVMFIKNQGPKNDPNYGYARNTVSWVPIAGVISSAK